MVEQLDSATVRDGHVEIEDDDLCQEATCQREQFVGRAEDAAGSTYGPTISQVARVARRCEAHDR